MMGWWALSLFPIVVKADDPYAFLSAFDPDSIIDDSASIRSHQKEAFSILCTARDADIWSLNHQSTYKNVNDVYAVEYIFSRIDPEWVPFSWDASLRYPADLNPYVQALRN